LVNKITVYEGCIGSTCEDIKLGSKSNFGDSKSSIIFDEAQETITVQSITLDELIKKYNIKECNFIKMDIEGGEAIVLPNIKNYLERNKPTLHLSLHSFRFKDIEKDSRTIIDVLKIYKNIYSESGEPLKLDNLYFEILLKGKKYTLVATDLSWPS
jgi:hypothetical protein